MERSVLKDKIRVQLLLEGGIFASEIALLNEKDNLYLWRQLALHTAALKLAEIISSSRNTCFKITNSTKDVELSINTGKNITKVVNIAINLNSKECYSIVQ